MRRFSPPSRVYGVDFSGAQDAGRNIWVAEGIVERSDDRRDDRPDGVSEASADDTAESDTAADTGTDDTGTDDTTGIDAAPDTAADDAVDCGGLHIRDCRPATEWFDLPAARDRILPALTAFLGGLPAGTAVGLDFPFGLPAPLVTPEDWESFLFEFPSIYSSPEDLRARCTERAGLVSDGEKTKLFRATDEPMAALSPYDLRLQSQTFYGIRDVLRPLVVADLVRVHPMQSPDADRPSLLEVYPAGTLDDLGLHHTKYKDGSEAGRERREEILDGLAAHGVTVAADVRERAVADDGGDALDAVVATVSTYRNTRDTANLTTDDDLTAVEGYIYV